jgi:mannose-6-phosphate isomerase-like protein (cupin superfamily)
LEEWDDKRAQRILLKKGDSFYIPPGNIYRLENHSGNQSCTIYWTIIKPMSSEGDEIQTDKTSENLAH